MLDLTSIGNIEKSIERNKKQKLGQIPKDLNSLHCCLNKENWKQLLKIGEADSFVIEFVSKNNDMKAIIFIDKLLADKMKNEKTEKFVIFVDGTFATVPQLKNKNCQLWTIVMRHGKRVSKTINVLVH